jgi:hypothetical protein
MVTKCHTMQITAITKMKWIRLPPTANAKKPRPQRMMRISASARNTGRYGAGGAAGSSATSDAVAAVSASVDDCNWSSCA